MKLANTRNLINQSIMITLTKILPTREIILTHMIIVIIRIMNLMKSIRIFNNLHQILDTNIIVKSSIDHDIILIQPLTRLLKKLGILFHINVISWIETEKQTIGKGLDFQQVKSLLVLPQLYYCHLLHWPCLLVNIVCITINIMDCIFSLLSIMSIDVSCCWLDIPQWFGSNLCLLN